MTLPLLLILILSLKWPYEPSPVSREVVLNVIAPCWLPFIELYNTADMLPILYNCEALSVALNNIETPTPPVELTGFFSVWSKVIAFVTDVLKLSDAFKCRIAFAVNSFPKIVKRLSGAVAPMPTLPLTKYKVWLKAVLLVKLTNPVA